MRSSGTVLKMKSAVSGAGEPVRYSLPLGDALVPMNEYLGQPVALRFNGDIFCVGCGKKTKKTFQDGYCYACFLKVPECEECVMRPELCRAHEGQARDMEWARTHCLIDQFVYLSITSDVKVGVTRHTQIPTRWVDQGAVRAIKLARTPNRYTAGLIEVALKKHMKDKTDWRRMLKNEYPDLDLLALKKTAASQLPADLAAYVIKDDAITSLVFPVSAYADKVKSLGFDKEPLIAGTLMGIKGQYLLFDGGRVVNIRKHQGYLIELCTGADAGNVGVGAAQAPAVAPPAASAAKSAKKSVLAKVAKKKTTKKRSEKSAEKENHMTVELIRAVLGWSLVFNWSVLFAWFVYYFFFRDFYYRFHGRMFNLTVEQFGLVHYGGMAIYKIFILVFNLAPYLALRLLV